MPDGRIDLKPTSRETLEADMRLASAPEDAAAELQQGHIIYVDSVELAERIIGIAGLTNWGLIDDDSEGNDE